MTQETPTLPLIAISGPIHPTETTTPTLQVALAIATDIAEARAGLAIAIYEEQRARVAFERAQVGHEKAVIDTAGGEKALGPNEAAQKRAIADLIEQFPSFVATRDAYHEATLDRRLAEADVAQLEAQHAVLLAALQARLFHIPNDWIYLPGEQRPTLPIAFATLPTNGSHNGNGHHPV